jgi:hypothetical protein
MINKQRADQLTSNGLLADEVLQLEDDVLSQQLRAAL